MTVEVIENLFTVVVDETTENVTVTYIGAQGPVGPGVAGGGTAGQYLRKTSSVDYASEWDTIDISTSDVTGTLPITKGGTNATTASGARASLSAAILGANNDITSMTGVTGGISTPDYVDFDTAANPALVTGRLAWNSDDGTLDVGLANNVVLQSGQELLYYAKNTSGGSIPVGAAVMFTGTVGASGKLTFSKAVSDGSVSAEYMMGVATQTVADNGFGYITDFGLVRGFNTTGSTKTVPESWQDGDLLYLDPVYPGELTKVQPSAPNLHSPIAVVVNASSGGSGSIFVRMKTGENLNELHDVKINGSLAANSFLVYDSTDSRWENRTATESRTALGLGTIATQNSDNVSVTGGSINNTAIGGTTPAAGTFTTLGVTTSINASGAATNIDLNVNSKGTGSVRFNTGGGEQLRVIDFAGANTYVSVTGQNNASPGIFSAGSPTNIGFNFSSKGSGGFGFFTNTFGQEQFRVADTASAVNYVQVTGAATAFDPIISAQGSDSNRGLRYAAKGAGGVGHRFFGNSSATQEIVRFTSVNAGNAYVNITGGSTGMSPIISVDGTDTNIDLALTTKGTGAVRFNTGGGEQVRISNIASAVNYVQVTGAATNNSPRISSQGSDSLISLGISAKGAGDIFFQNSGNASTGFIIRQGTGTVVNYLQVASSATGNAPVLSSQGSDTNIDLALTPKGTGLIRFGTYVSNAATTFSLDGYIELKDAAGNIRKLAVIA